MVFIILSTDIKYHFIFLFAYLFFYFGTTS